MILNNMKEQEEKINEKELEKEESKEEKFKRERQEYLDRINEFHQDYDFLTGRLNWRCII